MTGVDTPRRVRLASLLVSLLAPVGLLLIADGFWELRWWGSTSADRLLAVIADIKSVYGVEPPILLRGHGGAVELIVLGLACMACAGLAPLLSRGRRWARTAALLLAAATFFVGLAGLGIDAILPEDLAAYFRLLRGSALQSRIPEINTLIYPGWYSWVEDIAQGLQVLLSAAVVAAILYALIAHADYFVSKKAEVAAPDEWDAAISRLHRKTVGAGDATHTDPPSGATPPTT